VKNLNAFRVNSVKNLKALRINHAVSEVNLFAKDLIFKFS